MYRDVAPTPGKAAVEWPVLTSLFSQHAGGPPQSIWIHSLYRALVSGGLDGSLRLPSWGCC